MPATKEITLAAMIGSIRLYVRQPEPQSRSPRISIYALVTIVWDVADRWRRNLFSPGRCEHIPGAICARISCVVFTRSRSSQCTESRLAPLRKRFSNCLASYSGIPNSVSAPPTPSSTPPKPLKHRHDRSPCDEHP
jgi:hypothetical protein